MVFFNALLGFVGEFLSSSLFAWFGVAVCFSFLFCSMLKFLGVGR